MFEIWDLTRRILFLKSLSISILCRINALNTLFLVHALDAVGADSGFLPVNSDILQIYLLGAFGSDIGMASALR